MFYRTNVSAEEASALFDYDPLTGVFLWKITRTGRGGRAAIKGNVAGTLADGYRFLSINGGQYLAHRVAWLIMTGGWPEFEVDHKNRDRGDNRWKNLRIATSSQNRCNAGMPRHNTSGVRGVSWSKKRRKWRVTIQVHGVFMDLGCFASKEDAANVRREAEIKYHGEFAPMVA